MELRTPTNALVEKYISQFNKDERYFAADSAILNLFDAFPGNKKLEDILLKISVINDLYSTNIFSTYNMAKHIQSLSVDSAIQRGDAEAVHQIATGHGIRTKKKNTEINFYSFATKYCNWHNRDKYAIYDTFVHKILIAYKGRDDFSDFEEKDLKDFKSFKNIVQNFIDFYKLTRHDLKEIDKFLWIYGKEKFPPNY